MCSPILLVLRKKRPKASPAKKKKERAGEQRKKEGKEVQTGHFTQSRQLTALTQEVTMKNKKKSLTLCFPYCFLFARD